VVDPLPSLVASSLQKPSLFIPYDRNHPSPAGHRLIAQSIATYLDGHKGRHARGKTAGAEPASTVAVMAKGPKNPEKSFGVSVGAVLLVIAAALWWRGRVGRAEILGGIGAVLLLFGAVRPQLLKWPSASMVAIRGRARLTSTRAFC
jgi:hypothetical protein